jgi:hypothetical protein
MKKVVMNNKMIINVFFILSIFCCENKNLTPFEQLMEEFGRKYPLIKNNEWKLNDSFGYIFEDDALVKVSRNTNDTIITLELSKGVIGKGKEAKTSLEILKYYNAFNVEGWIHSLHFNKNEDTLYYFRMPKDDFSEVDFFFGEYEFHYEQGDLTGLQKKYFLAHRDSLRKIKGNNLPPLPEMDN